jgi:nitroimidazol reductase NimA-like FMN-containing flavoprotein (pyridoxamine 5'-phosphate oxidase superfamily)
MQHPRKAPTIFRDLSRDECLAILGRHDVGRLAFTFHDRVDIEPLNYVMVDGDLAFRTVPGSKVDVLRHHPWVAFEVDEVDGINAWSSVVVHGTIYLLRAAGSPDERRAYDAAVERIREITPTGASKGESVLLRLHVERLTGREARAT